MLAIQDQLEQEGALGVQAAGSFGGAVGKRVAKTPLLGQTQGERDEVKKKLDFAGRASASQSHAPAAAPSRAHAALQQVRNVTDSETVPCFRFRSLTTVPPYCILPALKTTFARSTSEVPGGKTSTMTTTMTPRSVQQ